MAKYNGHPNWTMWNVSLWINNDEPMYRAAQWCIRNSRNRKEAAERMLATLHCADKTKTPDGAVYSISNIIHAMRGM